MWYWLDCRYANRLMSHIDRLAWFASSAGTATIAATKTFPKIRGMSHSGRSLKFSTSIVIGHGYLLNVCSNPELGHTLAILRGDLCRVRPAWAHSCGWKSRRKLITANEVKRNCMRVSTTRQSSALYVAKSKPLSVRFTVASSAVRNVYGK